MSGGVDFGRILDEIGTAAAEAIPKDPEGYEKDGLVYCHKCNTPKQTKIEMPWGSRIVWCMCECESQKYDAEEERMKAQLRMDRLERRRKMGFPDAKMREWRFEYDDGSNPKIGRIARNFARNFREFMEGHKGLLLYGPVGTGKTYFAACIVNELIDRGIPCMMTSISRVANNLQFGEESRQEQLDSLNQFDLLVLDDLAAERKTEYMNEIVNSIIDARYRSGLPLIVTTNLTGEEMNNPGDLWNKRIYSRLMQMCQPVAVTGSDRRREALKTEHEKWRRLLEADRDDEEGLPNGAG